MFRFSSIANSWATSTAKNRLTSFENRSAINEEQTVCETIAVNHYPDGADRPDELFRTVGGRRRDRVVDGYAEGGDVELRVVFHLGKADGDDLTGTMDSPDQGAKGIPLGSVSGTGRSVRITVPAAGGVYEGAFEGDGNQIVGTWSQEGNLFR